MKIKNEDAKYYKGVFYWYSLDDSKWHCDLFIFPESHPFDTQK